MGKLDGAKYRAILEENLLESAKELRLGGEVQERHTSTTLCHLCFGSEDL